MPITKKINEWIQISGSEHLLSIWHINGLVDNQYIYTCPHPWGDKVNSSFYNNHELKKLGLKKYGKNVQLSRKASYYSTENIEIGDNVRIDDFCILSGHIQIGSYVHIGSYSALYGQDDKIVLHDFSGLSARVSVYTFSDDYRYGLSLTNPTVPDKYKIKLDKGPVIIHKHAIIGAAAIIMPKTTIGEGAAINAHSLARGNLDPWYVYAGIPAKARTRRKSKDILKLEKAFLADIAAAT